MRKELVALVLITGSAWASSAPLADFTRRAVASLPVHKDDRDYADKATQLDTIAVAIADHSKAPPGGIAPKAWASLMLSVAYNESGLSQRIVEHRCKPRECDSGRAKGLGQLHANSLNRDEWRRADGDIALQVKMLDDGLRRGFFTCSRSGVAFPAGAINGYAGRMCSAKWPGLDKRLATFNGLVAR